MIQATRLLSEFVSSLHDTQLPPEVVEQTKLYISDYYAACIAGFRVNAAFNEALLRALGEKLPEGKATLLFSGQRTDARTAAFLNAVYAHGADMDDGNRKAMGHVAAHVMSAVFALAEELEADWASVLTAINAGYEVYNRVSAAAQPGLVRRGFHSTGTAGAIACGAACAKLLGLDAQGIFDAMSIAAVQASGLFVIMESGQCCKPLNPANAAAAGCLAARLAQNGVHGPENPLESPKGWFHAMTDAVNETRITEGLGTRFTIMESYLKPYPACRHTHCGIDAALALRGQIPYAEIESVDLYIYHNAIPAVGNILVPKTVDDAKFSICYAVAAALRYGRFGFAELEVSELDESVLSLIDKICLIEDDTLENADEGIRGARMVITAADGRKLEHTVLIPKGDAANPFTWADIERKLFSCASGIYSEQQCLRLLSYIQGLEHSQPFRHPEQIQTIKREEGNYGD